jgi:hypothetical protein
MRADDIKSRTIYPKFDMGDVVYYRTAKEQRKGIVVGLNVRPTGIQYCVAWAEDSCELHFDMELTTVFEPDYGPAGDDE